MKLKFLNIRDWPIVVKALTIMVMVAVLPLAVVVSVSTFNMAQTLRSQIGESFTEVATNVADKIGLALVDNVHQLQLLAGESQITTGIETANAAYEGTEFVIRNNLTTLDTEWQAAADTDPAIRRIISADARLNQLGAVLHQFAAQFPQHVVVIATDRYGATVAATARTPLYYQFDESWWKGAWNRGQGEIYVGNPFVDENTGIATMEVAVPIIDDEGVVIGVLATIMDTQTIVDIVGGVQIGDTGTAFVVNKHGVNIFDPNVEYQGETLPERLFETGFLDVDTGGWVQSVDETGQPALIGFSKASFTGDILAVELLDWTTVFAMEDQEALAPVSATRTLGIAVAVVAFIIAVALASLMIRLVSRQVREIMTLFQNIGMGDFDARVDVFSEDELGQMAYSLNAMLDNILDLIQTREERDAMQSSIIKLLDEVSGAADGDLSVEAEVTTDITGSIADAFNFMIGQLREIIEDVQDATQGVTSSASEIQLTAERLSQGSEEQAAQIADTSKAIDAMAASIQMVSESAARSASVGQKARLSAQHGVQAVQNTIDGMHRIRDQVQDTAKQIKRLGETSQEVGEIVKLISEIADRTSILALNASIQAAMAGEAGQGFAVVADEVERLAERSTEATKQIEALISSIQNEMNEAVLSMESTTTEVVEGSLLAEEAGHALEEIGAVSNQLAELIQSISITSEEQARGSESLARSMGEIAEVTRYTAEGTKEAANSINQLAGLADQLRNSVRKFVLPGTDGQQPEPDTSVESESPIPAEQTEGA